MPVYENTIRMFVWNAVKAGLSINYDYTSDYANLDEFFRDYIYVDLFNAVPGEISTAENMIADELLEIFENSKKYSLNMTKAKIVESSKKVRMNSGSANKIHNFFTKIKRNVF